MITPEITREVARKVLATVDAGLVNGLGKPLPGKMCVEAAVCYALGLPHSDDPKCVAPALRTLKISLNDLKWSSPKARAKGLRRLAIAQLGSAGVLDEGIFLGHVVEMTIKKIVPMALHSSVALHPDKKHKNAMEVAAKRCETEGTKAAAKAAANAAASAARAAASAANAAANAAVDAAASAARAADAAAVGCDRVLSFFAEEVVQILIDMKAPGCEYLDLTEAA